MKYKKITIQNNKELIKFFNKNKKYKDFIEDSINKNTIKLIEEKPYKIKTCYGLKYDGKTIFEYKISYNKFLEWRVAYIYRDDEILVFFISNIIIKNEFVKSLTKVRGVAK
ncbi:MAG: hypothetical protein KIB43_01150 [Clostridium baratii]|uniref:hypothetical protein n=1 Tax=Clostridium baratii TaxID=1561 RepID=UPI0006C29AE8|nr:hypothetical protein [Clostridium baratii]MBS6005542.1 hypothetical protein [Clostridium baratii]MDU1052608.1 hypothetical protein [Clostridium baratii]MDU4910104.1 hypothetical protein [Clostridium baratii]CUP32288.1 Uncharacterised protein [Clostridium baratii]